MAQDIYRHGFAGESSALGFINAGALVVFDEGFRAQQRQDILEAVLLAQHIGDQRSNRIGDPRAWWEHYRRTLAALGWVTSANNFTETSSRELGTMTLHNATVQAMAPLLVPDHQALLQNALSAFQSLPAHEPCVQHFTANSQHQNKGTFQVLLIQEYCGATQAILSTVTYRTNFVQAEPTSPLSTYELVIFQASTHLAVVDDILYGELRSKVQAKLERDLTQQIYPLPTTERRLAAGLTPM